MDQGLFVKQNNLGMDNEVCVNFILIPLSKKLETLRKCETSTSLVPALSALPQNGKI